MEKLGCEVAVVMIEPRTGEIYEYGSEKGIQFLQQNEAIPLRFVDFFSKSGLERRSYGHIVRSNCFSDTCTLHLSFVCRLL